MDKIKYDLKKIRHYINDLFKDENTGHDISHLENVLKFAKQIQAIEGGNLYVITISSYLHDLHRLMSDKDNYVTPKMSLVKVKEILDMFDIDFKDEILFCIENHENKGFKETVNLETLILQDADILDMLGKRGLDRTLQYCKTFNIPLVNYNYPLDVAEYAPNTNPISTCHYVYRNLIPACKKLNTKTAQKIANKSTKAFVKFLEKYYSLEKLKIL